MIVHKFYLIFALTQCLSNEIFLIAIESVKIARVQSEVHDLSEIIAHKASSSIDWWNLISNVS